MIKKIGGFDELLKKLGQRRKYIKKEYQAYGLKLAEELGDWKNRSLYIKLAKQLPRGVLDQARFFIKDQQPNKVKSKVKLFMWKLKELKQQAKHARKN